MVQSVSDVLENREWREATTKAAEAIFPNVAIKPVAKAIALSHPWAIDYLRQAPVIALAVCGGKTPSRSETVFIMSRFYALCKNKAKLSDVMKALGLPLPMRRILPYAVNPSGWTAVKAACLLRPIELGNVIPDKPGEQRQWLSCVDTFLGAGIRRMRSFPRPSIEWAVKNLGKSAGNRRNTATAIADFVLHTGYDLTPDISFHEAMAAVEQWHVNLRVERDKGEFERTFGLAFDESFGALPYEKTATVGKYEFIALNSGQELFIEGVAMHHCVASYASAVLTGKSEVFSVRENGDRIATLEIAERPRKVVQLSGHCNRPVPASVKIAARQFASSINVG